MEILFYTVSFCPQVNKQLILILPIQFSGFCCRELGTGCRQFHAGEKGQGGMLKIYEELHVQGAEESYLTILPVKFTIQL